MRQNVTSATSKSYATASRRGVALVMFVMLVFAFMGMAALCIDIGMASLTQAQMQNAVDSAALEGIGGRDELEPRPLSDRGRRRHAALLVRNVFDDDFTPSAVDPSADSGQFSAGPIVRVDGGVGEANALALLSQPEPSTFVSAEKYVDDPALEANVSMFGVTANRPEGDMVSGRYEPDVDHAEPSNYVRDDFATAPNLVEGWRALSFLVRMRRSGDANPLDRIPTISSSGPTVPLIFGLGSTIHAADGSDYDPRRDGLTVRATAIASVIPVYNIGSLPFTDDCNFVLARRWPLIPNVPSIQHMRAVYGLGPVAIRKSFWLNSVGPFDNDMTTFTELQLDHATGELRTLGGESAGRLYFGDTSQMRCPGKASTSLTSVGDPLEVPYSPTWANRLSDWVRTINLTPTNFGFFSNVGRCFIPIYTSISGVDRVIGFVHVTIQPPPGWVDGTVPIRITLDCGFNDQDEIGCAVLVAPENANGQFSKRLFGLSDADRQQVFDELIDLTYTTGVVSHDWRDVRDGALLAPALVR